MYINFIKLWSENASLFGLSPLLLHMLLSDGTSAHTVLTTFHVLHGPGTTLGNRVTLAPLTAMVC